jgi:hypothetical protein
VFPKPVSELLLDSEATLRLVESLLRDFDVAVDDAEPPERAVERGALTPRRRGRAATEA